MTDLAKAQPTIEARPGLGVPESSSSGHHCWQSRVSPELESVWGLWFFLLHSSLRLMGFINVLLRASSRVSCLFAWRIRLSNFKALALIFISGQWYIYISKRALETKNYTAESIVMMMVALPPLSRLETAGFIFLLPTSNFGLFVPYPLLHPKWSK